MGQPILGGSWLGALWGLLALSLLAQWAVAALLVGPGASASPGGTNRASDRFGRAAMAGGHAALSLLAAVVLLRGASLAMPSLRGGPQHWFDMFVKLILGSPRGTPPVGDPGDVMLWLGALYTGVLAVLWAAFALRQRSNPPKSAYRVPHRDLLAAVIGVAAIAFCVGTNAALRPLGASAILLDLAAAWPVICAALVVWTRARSDAPPDSPIARAAAVPAPTIPDAASIWVHLGAMLPDSQPLFSTKGNAGVALYGIDADVWRDVGGIGPPPGALEAITPASAPFQGWLVGDLPDPTERMLLAALLLRTLQVDGVTCLVVTEDIAPDASGRMRSALRDDVARAIEASGSWPCGPLVVGERELREAIAGQRFPAAAFLTVSELSSQGIRSLGKSAVGAGAVWASGVGLIVVPQIDRGTPLTVTHRMFTLRRLTLAMHAAGARWCVVATGFGGPTTRVLVEQSFSGISVRDTALAPRATAPVRVWTPTQRFVAAPGAPWVRRALEPVVRSGLFASVGDPKGSFDLATVEVEAARVKLVRDVALDGDASACELDEPWFLASLRALPNRVPLPDGRAHHALWKVDDDPVIRFLLRPGTLDWLTYEMRMPAPRPLVGYQNRLLARAHLNAALREGEQDIEALAGLFGRSLVDQVVGNDFRATRWAFRTVPGRSGVSRVPLAPALAGEVTDPLRDTVTDNTVQVVDRNGGRVLLEVDRVVAETRFHPHRVFAVGNRRFEVPMHAFDDKRGQIQVEMVDAARPLTRPLLSVELSLPELIESPHEVVSGKLAFGLSAYEVTARETVSGVIQADGKTTTYSPVASQYRTRARVISFRGGLPPSAHAHLAHSMGSTLSAHLLAGSDEVVVIPLSDAFVSACASLSSRQFHQAHPTSVAVVDRFVQGMGVTNALDGPFVEELMAWVRAILAGCKCADGCHECSPPEALENKPDKAAVLKLLGV